MKDVLIIQRYYPDFREPVFDGLNEKLNLTLICTTQPQGKIHPPTNIASKTYIKKLKYFRIGEYIFFSSLLFYLIIVKPATIISEGGKNTLNNIAVALYAKLFNKQFILWDLGKGYKTREPSLLQSCYQWLYKTIALSSDQIFTYNTEGKDYFFNQIGYKSKITIIPNTVDTRKIKQLMNDRTKLNSPGLSEKIVDKPLIQFMNHQYDRILLYVGSLNPDKSLSQLVKILSGCNAIKPGLIIVGSGDKSYVNTLKDEFNPMLNHVFFAGRKEVSQLTRYYEIADFFILPGLGGLAIHQSMAFGLPVIVFKADGSEKDVIIHEETGFIAKNIEHCINIIEHTELSVLISMRQRCRDFINTNYSIEKYISTFVGNV